MSVSSSQLVSGDFSYQVFVKATAWTGSSQIESHVFRVSESGLSVTLTGPDRIAGGGVYTYQASAVSCEKSGEGDQPESLKVS